MLIISWDFTMQMRPHVPWNGIFAFVGLSILLVSGADAQNWTRYRGANGSGISAQKGIPVTWSPGDYKWKVTLPGVGHSSPVIWKHRLFVTSAIDRGTLRFLYCIDTDTGKTLWKRSTGLSRSHKHSKSSWASATPPLTRNVCTWRSATRKATI